MDPGKVDMAVENEKLLEKQVKHQNMRWLDYTAITEKIISDPESLVNRGMVPDNQPPEQPQKPVNSMRELSLLRESGVPERTSRFRPEMSTSEQWTENYKRLISSLGKGTIAVLIGTRGAGKTQLATCAIMEFCRQDKSALYAKALDIFVALRSTYHSDDCESTEDRVIRRYLKPKLLVIDSIENRSESNFENMIFNHIVDLRYDAMLDTILISNQDEKAIAASMGVSIVDRIHECGIKIVCNWQSFRRKTS